MDDPRHVTYIRSIRYTYYHTWCGHALFYVADFCIWRVQLPRGKPVKLIAISTARINLASNDQFVFARGGASGRLLLFARDGTILYDDVPLSFRNNAQLTGSGLAVYDRHANTVTTWPGGQSHAVDSSVYGLSVRSTNLATPVFMLKIAYLGEYHTYVDGKVVRLLDNSWERGARDCPVYGMARDGIYMRDEYRAGLLALRRGGLPKELRWHIMDY
jgi:hypothetical protein